MSAWIIWSVVSGPKLARTKSLVARASRRGAWGAESLGEAAGKVVFAAEPLAQGGEPAGVEDHVPVAPLVHRGVDPGEVIPEAHGVEGADGVADGAVGLLRALLELGGVHRRSVLQPRADERRMAAGTRLHVNAWRPGGGPGAPPPRL